MVDLEPVLDSLYQSIDEPAALAEVLSRAADLLPGVNNVSWACVDKLEQKLDYLCSRISPAELEPYRSRIFDDPRMVAVANLRQGEHTFKEESLVTHDWFTRTEYYSVCFEPYDIEWFAVTGGFNLTGLDVYLVFNRGQTWTDFLEFELEAIQPLASHVVRAARYAAVARDQQDYWVDLPVPFLEVNSELNVRFMNPAAELLVRTGELQLKSQRMRLSGAREQLEIERAVKSLGERGRIRPEANLRFEITSDCYRFLLAPRVVRYADLSRRLVVGIVVLERQGIEELLVPWQRALTPAEYRVTRALAAGMTLQTYANHTGRSVQTVRTQLKSVMQKLGVSSQVDLLRKILRP